MKITVDTAKEIIEHHFGKAAKQVHKLRGGLVNFVYEATVDHERYIVRISDDVSRLQYFQKEQWAVQKAAEVNVPVPEILEVGNEASKFPYMIVRYANGSPAADKADRGKIIQEMGKYTALINSIESTGFGHVFDWSSNQLSKKETWKEYLEKELEVEKRLEILHHYDMLTEDGEAALKTAIREMSSWNYKPHLNHGDMRLKNILLDEKGKISAILDWEFCTSNIAPQWDLAIALDDFSIPEKERFLDGYGMSAQEYRRLANGIKVLNILNFAPFVEVAENDIKSDEKKKKVMDHMKSRLRGAFDLYSIH